MNPQATLHNARADIRRLAQLRASDTPTAGGKGAHLGELIASGIPTPEGFVICADVWSSIRDSSGLRRDLERIFKDMDPADTADLEHRCAQASTHARHAHIPQEITHDIEQAFNEMIARADDDMAVIVRSSATREDSALASFAGMNMTIANVYGYDDMIKAVRSCWASIFAPRSVFYRADHGFPIEDAQIAVVVQRYIPATRSGVMFTRDPTRDDDEFMVIEAVFGGGESIVSGNVTPDRFTVARHPLRITNRTINSKRVRTIESEQGGTRNVTVTDEAAQMATLDDMTVMEIARLGIRIDMHYGSPQDIEWLIDKRGRVWVVQSRPITTSRDSTIKMPLHAQAPSIAHGIAASGGLASGRVCRLDSPRAGSQLASGDVLVAPMTAPDWIPVLRRAAAIVTDAGGVTCHAAIVARELGIPCVVGTGNATQLLATGHIVTVDGDRGLVFDGVAVDSLQHDAPVPHDYPAPSAVYPTATRIMVNLASPDIVDSVARRRCDGIGLIRAEQLIVDALGGRHPLTVIESGDMIDAARALADAIGTFAAAFAPRPVTYRTVDFRTNEFRNLDGGDAHEPIEANPMIGFRGAGRYALQPELLQLEARALNMVVDADVSNVHVMLPFVRTPRDVSRCMDILMTEAPAVLDHMDLWIMAEVPSIRWYLRDMRRLGVHGISIGSNDLTQLLLGADRDSKLVSRYDASDSAVMSWISETISAARMQGLMTSICGQAPTLYPEYVDMLVSARVDAISVPADALETTRYLVACAELRAVRDEAPHTWGRWDSNPRPTD